MWYIIFWTALTMGLLVYAGAYKKKRRDGLEYGSIH